MFKPRVNKKSEKMLMKSSGDMVPAHERLYKLQSEKVMRKAQAVMDRANTFAKMNGQPVINKKS
jgi:hypothetical protein